MRAQDFYYYSYISRRLSPGPEEPHTSLVTAPALPTAHDRLKLVGVPSRGARRVGGRPPARSPSVAHSLLSPRRPWNSGPLLLFAVGWDRGALGHRPQQEMSFIRLISQAFLPNLLMNCVFQYVTREDDGDSHFRAKIKAASKGDRDIPHNLPAMLTSSKKFLGTCKQITPPSIGPSLKCNY